jgi:hypothetical protein
VPYIRYMYIWRGYLKGLQISQGLPTDLIRGSMFLYPWIIERLEGTDTLPGIECEHPEYE